MYPITPPDFDSIDWTSILRSMGVHIPTGEPFVYTICSEVERTALAHYLIDVLAENPKLPKCYVSDYLDEMVHSGKLMSFDKACIRFTINRPVSYTHLTLPTILLV